MQAEKRTNLSKAQVGWWIAFVGIVISGFVLTGTGYRHGLPFIDFPDEMTIWTIAHEYVDPAWPAYGQQYPPGILMVSAFVQRAQIALGDPYLNPAGTVEVLRLMSVGTFAITLALVMLLARRMAGPLAGICAGLFWLVLPIANELAKLSTVNVWVCAWFMASIWVGVEAWIRKSTPLIALSLILAMLAAVFKWQGGAAVGMAGLVCLSFWPSDRRRTVILVLIYLAAIGIFSYWAVFVHHALEGEVYMTGVKPAIPTLPIVLTNLQYQLVSIGPGLIFGLLPLIALVLAAILPDARRRLYDQMGLWSFPIIIIVFEIILSFNGAPVFDRHYLAVMPLLAVMAGIGVVLIGQMITRLYRDYRSLTLRATSAVAAIGLAVIVGVPSIQMTNSSVQLDAGDLRPDRQALFAGWARTTATEGPLLITESTAAAAIQTLYGYRGRTIETPYNQGTSIFPKPEEITQAMLDAKNIRYIITLPDFGGSQLKTPLTRLISYDNSDEHFRGDPWAAFYVGALPLLPSDQVITFGNEIQLRGYSLSKQTACPGDHIDMRLVWSAPQPPTRYYSFFLHLSGAKGEISAPINGQQPVSDQRPTISWDNPNELLPSPLINWSLPVDLAPGEYQLLLGLFDGSTYLILPDGKHYAVMTTIKVEDCTF